jgi:hypothetical protein
MTLDASLLVTCSDPVEGSRYFRVRVGEAVALYTSFGAFSIDANLWHEVGAKRSWVLWV